MEALSNDILLNILEQASKERGHNVLRVTLPLVCKRWMNAIYGATGRSLFRCVTLDYDSEYRFCTQGHWPPLGPFRGPQPPVSICTVAQWMHKNSECGNIRYPCRFEARMRGQQQKGNGQGLDMILAILGQKLQSLIVHGSTGLLDGFKFSYLWMVPNLRQLRLERVSTAISLKGFEKGIACLRHLEEFCISGQEDQRSAAFTSFPTVLCSLKHLTALSFENQKLGRLPREISQLAKLAHLSIESGSITHIEAGHLPSVLGRLTALESLALVSCLRVHQAGSGSQPDTRCWQSMTQLTRLALTQCYGGPEGQLPPEVGNLSGLVELDLAYFGELQDQLQLSTLEELKSIRITHSEMPRLPGWMGALPSLTSLQTIEVGLKECPSEGFRSLQCLGILCGDVPMVTDSIGQLTRLTSLSLMQCPLEELSSSISRLQNLRHLELETCYFLQFPHVLQALRAPQLRCVSLEGSPGAAQEAMAGKYGEENRPMPLNAGNLAWLLHHPRLEKVSITASKAETAALRKFKKELRRVCGRDVLKINCYSRGYW